MPLPVLVIGGGISGISTAVEASQAGCEVILVEREPWLGGRVAQMHQYFPKLCPPSCGLEIHLKQLRTSPRIQVHTEARVLSLSRDGQAIQARIGLAPRRVDDRCTTCGACAAACPAERRDTFNQGLGTTRALWRPHPLSWPERYALDGAACLGPSCGRCVAACPMKAIHLDAAPREIQVRVSSVVWATGWDPYDGARLEGLGQGALPDVVSSLALERMAALGGPTKGRIQRPSDGQPPRSVAFVQCAGSRDQDHLPHCSGVCCMGSLKQARYLWAQDPHIQVWFFHIDVRAPGRHDLFFAEIKKNPDFHLVKGKVARIRQVEGALRVEAEDVLGAGRLDQEVDLVVLATGLVPNGARGTEGLVPALDPWGFGLDPQPEPGVVVTGCARRPMDVASCTRDATAAALRALQATRRTHD